VFVLSDGRRFSCPQAFERTTPSAYTLEHAKACKRLTPLVIPASWRPVFAAIEKARSCLANQGMRVSGGPELGVARTSQETPIGELFIQNGNGPILIGFYESGRRAQQFEPTAIQTAKRIGGQLARRGAVIVFWTRAPTSQQRSTTEGCAFG
jgi:hypothetical protein